PALAGQSAGAHELPNVLDQGPVNDPAFAGQSADAHELPNVLDQGLVNDPALAGQSADAHELPNVLDQVMDNDPALAAQSADAHELPNVLDQGLVNGPAPAGQSADAHDLLNNPCHDREGPPDGAPDEDHGADTDEVGNALDQGPVNDPAHAGQSADAHELPNNPCHDREGAPDGAPDVRSEHRREGDEGGNARDQGPVNEHAHAGQSADAHKHQKTPCHGREGQSDGAPDEDEDHGADTDEVGNALDQGPVNDPAHAGQSADAHELPNNPCHDREGAPDGAPDV